VPNLSHAHSRCHRPWSRAATYAQPPPWPMLPAPLPLSLHAPVLGQSRRHPTPRALPDRHRMPPPSSVRHPLPPPCALPGHPRPPPAHCSVTPWRSLTAAHAWPSLGSPGLYRLPPVPCPAWPPPGRRQPSHVLNSTTNCHHVPLRWRRRVNQA
jgi:hypothetical protein